MAVELTVIPGVPLIRTGTYSLSSGQRVFAEEDLLAAADALNDPGVKAPRVRIASVAKALNLDPAEHGGEPAFGYVDNLRVIDKGQTLVGDFHVPPAVAGAMEWAYPSLSIEGTPPGWVSSTGRAHELVVTAVALLGVDWPGVTTLDDFFTFMAEGPAIEQTQDAPEEVLATMPQHAREVRAGLDVDLVARRFMAAVDGGDMELPDGVDSPWDLWVTAIRFDDAGRPYLKVVNEASGDLFRVDVKISGGDVTYGKFVPVVEQDVPVAASADVPRPAAPIARWGSREVLRAAVQSTEPRGGSSAMTEEQRRTLAAAHGLDPDSATEEQVLEALMGAAATPDPEPEPAPVVEEPTPEPALTATVSRQQWETQQAEIAELRAEAEERRTREARAHRDGLITAALSEGRIAPSERTTWREQLDAAPQATERLLASLTPNRVPVHERGQDDIEAGSALSGEGTGWFDDQFAATTRQGG